MAADRNKTNKDNTDNELTDTDIPDLTTTSDSYNSDSDNESDCDPVDSVFVVGIVDSVDGIKDKFAEDMLQVDNAVEDNFIGSPIVDIYNGPHSLKDGVTESFTTFLQ
eukprot:2018567-Ditylum_brightwellii.AAC.1